MVKNQGQMRQRSAFTIVELLVTIGIIALLLGFLVPAIGKARDSGLVTRSLSNLRQLAFAHAGYAATWNDNQWTNIPHDLMSYVTQPGQSYEKAMISYEKTNPDSGQFVGGQWFTRYGWGYEPASGLGKTFGFIGHGAAPPIGMVSLQSTWKYFGSFRMINVQNFNRYVGGRFYDSTFFAPKDRAVITAIGECFDAPGEYCRLKIEEGKSVTHPSQSYFSSYILSPAAMFTPDLFSRKSFTTPTQMWVQPGLFRSPTFSQARYPDLKTHMIEHHWLQRPRHECNPAVPIGQTNYEGCEPYYFNGGIESAPATLFYDGHIRLLGLREVIDADSQAAATGGPDASLWHRKTPLEPNHYHHDIVYTPPASKIQFSEETSSYHILTRHGIRGRDTFSQ